NYISPSIEILRGFTPDTVKNQPLKNIFTPKSLKKAIILMEKYANPERLQNKTYNPVITVELDQYHKDGSIIPTEIKMNLIRDQNGNASKILGVTRNITERKRNEERLKLYKKTIEASKDLIAAINDEYIYLFANNTFLEYHDLDRNQVIGHKVEDIIGKKVFNTTIKDHVDKSFNGMTISYEMKYSLPQVGERYFKVIYYPLKEKVENHDVIIAVIQDITEFKKAQQEIKRLNNFRKRVIENANVWLVVIDINANVIIWNKAAEKISGYLKEEVVGHNKIWKWFYPEKDSRKRIIQRVSEVIEKNEVLENYETIIRTKIGNNRIISWNARNLQDKDGNAIGLIALGRDITHIKELEGIIERSEEKYRFITETANDIITILNHRFKYIYTNQASYRILGYKKNEFIDKDLIELIHPDEIKKFMLFLRSNWNKNQGIIELRHRKKDGQYIWLEFNLKHFRGPNDRLRFLTILRDISERKRIEKLRDELYADIAHELRTPLTSIKGYTGLLLKSKGLTSEQKEDLITIIKNEERLEKIVNEIIDYSRLRSGHLILNKERISLQKIIQNIKDEFKNLIDEKNLSIIDSYDHDDEIIIDKFQITKVIRNLIHNALKFSFKNGIIWIKSTFKNNLWTFEIKDKGIGIPRTDLPDLFKRFIKPKNKINMRGIGIGLAICKKIIDNYNGGIWAESDGKNKGSTFRFQINLKK
ncbi:MAG: PAS domain S-box protein, partial [Candidatus Lokiarchaeota archaeon]|nr:PAS domain S-box protein [Candidatus Lokiarchaeota archaeon]